MPTRINNIDILLSEDVKRIADKSIVDYVVSPYGEGFAVRNHHSTCD